LIKGDYDWLCELAQYNVCAEHKTPLVVAWHSREKCWVLRCGVCEYPDAVTRQLSLTQEYKAGADIPEPVLWNIRNIMRRRTMSQNRALVPGGFEGVPNKDLATGELLAPEQVKALMNYAFKYQLDPFRGHLVLMYGKPYITIDGYLYYAKVTGKHYSLKSRPLSPEEEKQYKVGENDHAWVAELQFTETLSTFTGLGIVTFDEMTAKSKGKPDQLRSPVVAAHPWQLAQKRAEWQALRRAFPIGETQEEKGE